MSIALLAMLLAVLAVGVAGCGAADGRAGRVVPAAPVICRFVFHGDGNHVWINAGADSTLLMMSDAGAATAVERFDMVKMVELVDSAADGADSLCPASPPTPRPRTRSRSVSRADSGTRTPKPPIGEAPYIIYIDNPGTDAAVLKPGKRGGGRVSARNIAYFRFGSTVGLMGGDDTGGSGDAPRIGFNPIPAKSRLALDSPGAIPYYASPHGEGNASKTHPLPAVAPGYITAANLRVGKGDPCRLVGLTASQARWRADAGKLDDYRSGWRLPTGAENRAFAGASVTTPNSARGYWSEDGASMPGGASLSGGFLPAAGSINAFGELEHLNALGLYWSATPLSQNYGEALAFGPTNLHPGYSLNYSAAAPVRCVPDD